MTLKTRANKHKKVSINANNANYKSQLMMQNNSSADGKCCQLGSNAGRIPGWMRGESSDNGKRAAAAEADAENVWRSTRSQASHAKMNEKQE